MRERWFGRLVWPRLPRLMLGLVLFGAAIAMTIRSGLGQSPWETLHQGLSLQTGIPIGTVSILLGLPILLLWMPLGERPGIGTVLNVVTIGLVTNLVMAWLPQAEGVPAQVTLEAIAFGTLAVATGLYLSADLGPGPRDGLMTGIHHRFGWRIAPVRMALEGSLLLVGFLLGGTVGVGTVAFVLLMGPLTELSLRVFDPHGRVMRRRRAHDAAAVPTAGAA